MAGADFSCMVVVGHLGGAAERSGKKKESPTQSVKSTGKVNPVAPGWTRRESPGSIIAGLAGASALQ
ncbi:hypothetical protein ACQJBY_012811 [Aegilops geniculata]